MKQESIEEFIARGGTIEKLPTRIVPQSYVLPVKHKQNLMSLMEGEEAYGERKKSTKKAKITPKAVDVSALPKDLIEELKALGHIFG
jgi:hypothetical protein